MSDISSINPYIRVAMHSIIPAHYTIKRRIIFDYELIYIADGEFTLKYDGVDYKCETGQFVFLRPNVPHSFRGVNRDLSQPHIHFDITHTADSERVPVSFKDRPNLTDKEKGFIREDIFKGYPKTPFVTFSDTKKVLEIFYEIVGSELSPLNKKAKLIQLLDTLINDNFPNALTVDTTPYRIEKQIKDYIDAGQGLTARLEDIAKQFNYSKFYVERRFKEKYGVGLMAYRNEKRMQKAKELLPHSSVSAVAARLGFSSIYAFSRAFKNRFGVSPKSTKTAE